MRPTVDRARPPARVYWRPAVEVPITDCGPHGRFGAKKASAICDQLGLQTRVAQVGE